MSLLKSFRGATGNCDATDIFHIIFSPYTRIECNEKRTRPFVIMIVNKTNSSIVVIVKKKNIFKNSLEVVDDTLESLKY